MLFREPSGGRGDHARTMKTKNKLSLGVATLLVAGAFSSAVIAQDRPATPVDPTMPRNDRSEGVRTPPMSTSDQKMTPALKRADTQFFEKAALSGKEEVIVSQVALTKASDPRVKEFAQMMVNDHGGANTKLAQLASTKSVVLPAKEPSTEKWVSKKEGKGFDEEYMEKMVDAHKDAVDLFEKATKSTDADVAAFASSTLPTLQAHFAQAKEIKKSLK